MVGGGEKGIADIDRKESVAAKIVEFQPVTDEHSNDRGGRNGSGPRNADRLTHGAEAMLFSLTVPMLQSHFAGR